MSWKCSWFVCFLRRLEWCWDVATSGLGYFSCPLCALWKMWHGQRKSWTCLLWVLEIILHAHVVQFILYQSEGGSLHWVTKISLLIIYIVYPVRKQIEFRPQRCPVLKGSQYFVWFDWGYVEHKNAVLLSLPCSSFQLLLFRFTRQWVFEDLTERRAVLTEHCIQF